MTMGPIDQQTSPALDFLFNGMRWVISTDHFRSIEIYPSPLIDYWFLREITRQDWIEESFRRPALRWFVEMSLRMDLRLSSDEIAALGWFAVASVRPSPEEAENIETLSDDPLDGEQVVYFIKADNFIKIGFTNNIRSRMSLFQCGCPHELELLGTTPGGIAREHELHAQFNSLHHRGEWFRCAPELESFIQSLPRGNS